MKVYWYWSLLGQTTSGLNFNVDRGIAETEAWPEIHDAVLLDDGGELSSLVQGQHGAQGRVPYLHVK